MAGSTPATSASSTPTDACVITDRLKNIIVLANGKNVAPAPMEIAILTSRYIAQALILGDNQPYTGVLVVPDFDQLGTWAAANGMAEMPPEQLVGEKAVQKLIEGEVQGQARRLRHLRAAAPRGAAAAPPLRGGGRAHPVAQDQDPGRRQEVGGPGGAPLRRGRLHPD